MRPVLFSRAREVAYLIISRATGLGVKVLILAENNLTGGATASRGGRSGGLSSETEEPIPYLKTLETLAVNLIILLDFTLFFLPLSPSALNQESRKQKTFQLLLSFPDCSSQCSFNQEQK